ncbi:MAG: hypothetical protein K8M05_26610, partial [Deltaproteobacteria bacterium]|nr:hypothetical protein [Kofleriaceae bacterium]
DDAAAGRVVGSAAEAVLRCFRFDPAASARRARIQRAIQLGASLIFVALAATLVSLALRERRRRS